MSQFSHSRPQKQPGCYWTQPGNEEVSLTWAEVRGEKTDARTGQEEGY